MKASRRRRWRESKRRERDAITISFEKHRTWSRERERLISASFALSLEEYFYRFFGLIFHFFFRVLCSRSSGSELSSHFASGVTIFRRDFLFPFIEFRKLSFKQPKQVQFEKLWFFESLLVEFSLNFWILVNLAQICWILLKCPTA